MTSITILGIANGSTSFQPSRRVSPIAGCGKETQHGHHQLSINAPVAEVYEAISTADGIGTWWDNQTAKHTDRGLVLSTTLGRNTAW